jgi:hypothetical protein
MDMDRALLSLCLINTLWHKYKKTYVDNFVPLMATTFIKHNYSKIENDKLKDLINDFITDFGIPLTRNPTLAILHKCKKYQIVRLFGKTYHVNQEKAAKYDISKEIESNLEKQTRFFSDFKNFLLSISEDIISDDIISSLILEFIKNNDVGLFLSPIQTGEDLLPEPKLPHNYKRYKYIFSKYISKTYRENKEIFRILVEISLGSIATNALLFSFANKTSESIKDCDIYLDTSLLLRLIGADEKETIESVGLLLNSIRSNGAKLKIFNHTYDESRESLDACMNWVESIDFDPTKANKATLYFRQEGYKKSDIELILSSFDRLLKENDISMEIPPEYTYNNTLIDEKKFQNEFEEELEKRDKSFQKELYKRRTQRDIASICAISRLRYDRKYIKNIKEAKYLFVTTNGVLSFTNYRYNKLNHRNRNHEIPECVSDVFLGTYLWINTPQIADSVNYFKTIAIALSTIRPDPEMENELRNEAKKLLVNGKITQDDYILLTSSYLVKDLLSDSLFSGADAITESSIYSMLDEVKERLIGQKNNEIGELNKKFLAEKIEREKVEKRLLEDENRYNSMFIHLETMAMNNAKNISRGKTLLLKIFLILLILAPVIPAIFISRIFFIVSGLAGCISVLLSFLGCNFYNMREKIYARELMREKEKLQIDKFSYDESSNINHNP